MGILAFAASGGIVCADAQHRSKRLHPIVFRLVLIVSRFYAEAIRRILGDQQLASWQIGTVAEGPRGVWEE